MAKFKAPGVLPENPTEDDLRAEYERLKAMTAIYSFGPKGLTDEVAQLVKQSIAEGRRQTES
ncbi:MAG: hypothetical protein AB7L13_01585 [Acidimicrobiia bacterium]